MKIIITAENKDMADNVDMRFGRAKYFVVFDTATKTKEIHDNIVNINAPQGAGIQAAETAVRLGAEAVITGNVGPKAFRVLKTAGIRVFKCGQMSVENALKSFMENKLTELTEANVESHWQ